MDPGTKQPEARAPEIGRGVAPPWLRGLVHLMDDAIVVPGTSFRIGWDAVLGLVAPWVGDALSALSHVALLHAAFRAGVSPVVMARMVLNAAVDGVAGSVPLLGDLFDATYKANVRNLALIERVEQQGRRAARPVDYVVVTLAIVAVLGVLSLPAIVAVLVIKALTG